MLESIGNLINFITLFVVYASYFVPLVIPYFIIMHFKKMDKIEKEKTQKTQELGTDPQF